MSRRRRVDRPAPHAPHRAPPGPGPASGDRLAELDAVRGLAALAIVVYHFKPAWLPRGWMAVDLFLVLSGYLITGIVLRHGGEPGFLQRFYPRRWLRIAPAYFLLLGVLVVGSPILPRPVDWSNLPWQAGFVQNVPMLWGGPAANFHPYLGHAWTLAVEEQFYLIWPALVVLVGRGRRATAAMAAVVIVLSVAARASGLSWWTTPARCDALALGGLLAALRPVAGRSGRPLRIGLGLTTGSAIAALIAIGATAGFPGHGPPPWPGLTLLAVGLLWFGLVGLVVAGAGARATALFRRPWLRRAGVVAYGLYLYHYPILLLGDDLARAAGLRGRPFWRETLMVAASLAAASLSWRLVERPLLRLKGRLAYREALPATAEVPAPVASL